MVRVRLEDRLLDIILNLQLLVPSQVSTVLFHENLNLILQNLLLLIVNALLAPDLLLLVSSLLGLLPLVF